MNDQPLSQLRRLRIEPRPAALTARKPPDIGFVYLLADHGHLHLGCCLIPPSAERARLDKLYNNRQLSVIFYAEVSPILSAWAMIRAKLPQSDPMTSSERVIETIQALSPLTQWRSAP